MQRRFRAVRPATVEIPLAVDVSTLVRGVVLLQVGGELDLLTVPPLTERIDQVLRGGPHHLVLDLSGVSFLGASGLRALVRAKDRSAQHDTYLHLSGTGRRAVARPLEIVCLNRVFTMHRTWQQALSTIVGTVRDGTGPDGEAAKPVPSERFGLRGPGTGLGSGGQQTSSPSDSGPDWHGDVVLAAFCKAGQQQDSHHFPPGA